MTAMHDPGETLDLIIEMLDASDMGILIHDCDKILYTNHVTASIINVPAEIASMGQNIIDLLDFCANRGDFGPDRTGLDVLADAREGYSAGKVYEIDRELPCGKVIRTRSSARDNGTIIATYNDVTELITAMRDAKAAEQSKSQFLANMSHEIRTPMNGIMGMLELAIEKSRDPEQKSILHVASHAADSLLRLLNGILDYSRLEADEFDIVAESYNLHQLINDVVLLFRPTADAKRLSIITEVAANVPETVIGDSLRVRQILTNFMSNAIKFTKTGHIKIALLPCTDDSACFRVTVTDSGIGIPTAKQTGLFERFSQADTSSTREYGGAGLGLAICKQLVTVMNGTIGFNSHPGKGSTFWIGLPIGDTVSDTGQDASLLASEMSAIPRRLNILYAEDNTTNQQVMKAVLKRLEHDCTLVDNGQAAVEALAETDFDLVLMDIQMPVMDGLQATHAIRHLTGPKCATPIVAVTANAMAGDREKYIAGGMDNYLSKPIKPQRLEDILTAVYWTHIHPASSTDQTSDIDSSHGEDPTPARTARYNGGR